jgi:hypothetical protein
VTVPVPLLPVVGACGVACRPPLLVDGVVVVPVVVVVVVVDAVLLDEGVPAYEAAAA